MHTAPPRRSVHAPFPRIVCAVESDVAVEQALAVAGRDSRVMFAASWYGKAASDAPAREAIARALPRARQAGVEAQQQWFHAPRLGAALLGATAMHDLVVIGAHSHARATGIVLGEDATLLLHRCAVPVLVARERALESGIVVATRALPSDRRALTAAAHLARRLGAELKVVHIAGLGRAARAIVSVAEGDGAGLVVVGSDIRSGLSSLVSVSERVAHRAPCSVLVMRGG